MEKLPCEDCIVLSICKAKTQENSQSDYDKFLILTNNCSLISNYMNGCVMSANKWIKRFDILINFFLNDE